MWPRSTLWGKEDAQEGGLPSSWGRGDPAICGPELGETLMAQERRKASTARTRRWLSGGSAQPELAMVRPTWASPGFGVRHRMLASPWVGPASGLRAGHSRA